MGQSVTSFNLAFFFLFGLVIANNAYAYDTDNNLSFGDHYVTGQCVLLIDWDEPWAAINGDCTTFRNKSGTETQLAQHVVSGYDLDYPRAQQSAPYYFDWKTLKTEVPDVDAVYCNEFGTDIGTGALKVTLGHHSSPSQNEKFDVAPICYTPLPQVKIFTQLDCYGVGIDVFSLAAVIVGIHKSYRWITGSPMCWEVAVEGSY